LVGGYFRVEWAGMIAIDFCKNKSGSFDVAKENICYPIR
jgi:hypothetical protein